MLLFRFQNRIGSGNLTRRKDEMALGIFVFDLLKWSSSFSCFSHFFSLSNSTSMSVSITSVFCLLLMNKWDSCWVVFFIRRFVISESPDSLELTVWLSTYFYLLLPFFLFVLQVTWTILRWHFDFLQWIFFCFFFCCSDTIGSRSLVISAPWFQPNCKRFADQCRRPTILNEKRERERPFLRLASMLTHVPRMCPVMSHLRTGPAIITMMT